MWWIIGLVLLALIVILGINLMNPGSEPLATGTDTTATTTTNSIKTIPSETRAGETVFAIAGSISGASKFASLLSSTGVNTSVGTTTYTIFVPTDTAFNKTPAGYLSGLSSVEKKRLVQYHIIVGRAIDTDKIEFGTIQTMSNDALNFSVDLNKIPNVNSSNIVKQYKAKNGIVYVIDSVLLPPIKK